MPDGRVIAVLNMKGGVGKTTISAHVMRVLYHSRLKKTLLVDLDPQFNLTQCLISRAEYDTLKSNNQTIFTAMEPPSAVGLFDVAITSHAPPLASTLARRLRHFTDRPAFLDLIPGNFDLVKYSLIADQHKLGLVKQRFLQFISAARADYDVVVIDCNPSSSFITLCALQACQKVLVPIRPDRYSVLGLELLADFIARIPEIAPKPEMAILLNGVPRQQYDQTVENELRRHTIFGPLLFAAKLRHSKLLAASAGYTGFATDKPVPYRELLKTEIGDVVKELSIRWGI